MKLLHHLLLLTALSVLAQQPNPLRTGWQNPPPDARPHAYWLFLNGHIDLDAAKQELRAMKAAGFGGVLIFDMGARGDQAHQPPAGPAFLSDPWLASFATLVKEAKSLGLQVDFSVVSSWDLGGSWITPDLGSMTLHQVEATTPGGQLIDRPLPFPTFPASVPIDAQGMPRFWKNVATLAIPSRFRAPGHQFDLQLDQRDPSQPITTAVLHPGDPGPTPVPSSPVKAFSLELSADGQRFTEVLRGELTNNRAAQSFPLPPNTRATHARLRFLSAHNPQSTHWSFGEFQLFDATGENLAASHAANRTRSGALLTRSSPAYSTGAQWNLDNLYDGETTGPRGVYLTAGPPPFEIPDSNSVLDLSAQTDPQGHLRWNAPPGDWTIVRYVVMNSGERLKVPSPNSDGLATNHFNPAATRAHMRHVLSRLRTVFPNLAQSGLTNLYLASYEVVGLVWSPGLLQDFQRLRGYSMARYLPVVLGSQIGPTDHTNRFLFDYRKTLSDVLIDSYYRTAQAEAAAVGLGVKSEAGGPGPPIHNVPVDSLLANAAISSIQGEFWPFRPDSTALWVIKETASAGHIYGKRRIHMESFTSTHHWWETPQDLKPSADRAFTEGANHIVWHTWSHAPRDGGKPGWVYLAGSHINQNVTWFPQAKPFLDYLSRTSFLLQQGNFVADVLYYYGDGGYKFIPPRQPQPGLGPGYDYDFINSDALLHRLSVRNGRLVLPDGTSYALLVLPNDTAIQPEILARLNQLRQAGATILGPTPTTSHGLTNHPAAEQAIRNAATSFRSATPLEVLRERAIPPDFTAPATLDYTHRRTPTADIYFLRNTTGTPVTAPVTFRATGKRVEFWNPVNGQTTPASPIAAPANTTILNVSLPPHGSTFVIFQTASSAPPSTPPTTPQPTLEATNIDTPWTLTFPGHAPIPLTGFPSWTTLPPHQHFSGTATYATTIQAPKAKSTILRLTKLPTLATIRINGREAGILWCAPFEIDITRYLKPGANTLEIDVTNTWHNRLVGDANLPPPQRQTKTNVLTSNSVSWKDAGLQPSGLLGPVQLLIPTTER
jgi:hypothetical protein